MNPFDLFTSLVEEYATYLDSSGELHDPVWGVPTQYGTPYYALCNALVARTLTDESRFRFIEHAQRGLKVALTHVLDPQAKPPDAEFIRDTGATQSSNHRDFFWPAILKTFRLLRELGIDVTAEYSSGISQVKVVQSFSHLPPTNWSAVWLSGEWMRLCEGLTDTTIDDIDRWLEPFFQANLLVPQGLYQEPGHPNSYDLFTRYHLADLLAEGYNGRWLPELQLLLRNGLRRSLALQLSDGSLASAHRSTGHTWTIGIESVFFMLASRLLHETDPKESRQARSSAWLAFRSLKRWRRANGLLSPVENCLPPAYRVGYERYSADAHYASLALAFLGLSIHQGLEPSEDKKTTISRSPLWIEGDPIYRAVAHAGPFSLHINARPAFDYDGFGIVDLTFGPDRFFQFASTVKHLETGHRFNLGLAHRTEPGRSNLIIMAQQNLTLTQPIERGIPPASIEVISRPLGQSYLYHLSAAVYEDQVVIAEHTPGLSNYKTLIIPYLRDPGTGTLTTLEWHNQVIQFNHGGESVEFILSEPIESVLDLPYGFENRRGLCGLLRIDFQEPRLGINYRIKRCS